MSLEIAAALAVAAAWWTAAAASTSRHRLGLERFFSLTCWLVGAVGLVGGLLALVTGEERIGGQQGPGDQRCPGTHQARGDPDQGPEREGRGHRLHGAAGP